MQNENPLVYPKEPDRNRIQNYKFYDKLYFGDHFDAYSIKGEKEFTNAYNRLRYVVANFPGLISRVMADMLFGDRLTIDVQNKDTQQWLNALTEDNEFFTQLYESALANSRRGDSLFKLRVDKRNHNDLLATSEVIIEEITPEIYFPVFRRENAKNVPFEEVLATEFTQGTKTYLHKESHRPGFITNEVFEYDPNQRLIIKTEDAAQFGYDPIEETGVRRPLIFHVPNIRDSSGYFGTSDYRDLNTLFFALNNRLTKTDNILDKHSDPILAVPPGVLDEQGKIKKSALGMFEVNNDNAGFNKPEYIVWNANLEAAEKEIDRLVEMLYMFSEISPATMGLDKGGVAESGRALKFKLLRTIAKRNRKRVYYEQGIKDILETAQELAKTHKVAASGELISVVERPTLTWGEGIPQDAKEAAEIETIRIDQGTSSPSKSIQRLDNLDPEEAKKQAAEIEQENATGKNLPLTKGGAPFERDKPVPQPPNKPEPKPAPVPAAA